MQRGLEALDRFAKAFGAEAESLMMDRHDEISAGFIGHLHGLFRSAVRINPGIVSADRHDRQIDGTGSAQLRKRIAQRGVAAEKDTTVISLENVAVVTAIGVAPLPCAPMFYAERDDVDLAGESCYRLYFFPTQFAHVAEARPTKQITCPPGRDHRGRTIKSMERAHVEDRRDIWPTSCRNHASIHPWKKRLRMRLPIESPGVLRDRNCLCVVSRCGKHGSEGSDKAPHGRASGPHTRRRWAACGA